MSFFAFNGKLNYFSVVRPLRTEQQTRIDLTGSALETDDNDRGHSDSPEVGH